MASKIVWRNLLSLIRTERKLQRIRNNQPAAVNAVTALGVAKNIAALVVLMFSSHLYAQEVTVLKNVNVIDGTGAAVQRNTIVVIAGDRIRSVSTDGTRTPSHAKVIDMHSLTIMPLIINMHGHLGLVKGTSSSAANQT